MTNQITKAGARTQITAGPWGIWEYPDRCEIATEFPDNTRIDIAKCQGQNWKADARLIAAAPDLLEELRALEHLASVLNGRQHAGLEITPVMWSQLFQDCNRAKAVIAKAQQEVA